MLIIHRLVLQTEQAYFPVTFTKTGNLPVNSMVTKVFWNWRFCRFRRTAQSSLHAGCSLFRSTSYSNYDGAIRLNKLCFSEIYV